MAHLHRLIAIAVVAVVACWVALLPLRAHAGIPPTETYTYTVFYDGNRTGSSTGEVWAAVRAYVAGASPWYPREIFSSYDKSTADPWASCTTFPCSALLYIYSPGGYGGASSYEISRSIGSQTCPANSTLTGGLCVCNSGYQEQGSACYKPSEQELLCQSLNGTSSYGSAPGRTGPGASTCTATGCAGTFAGTVLVITDKQGVTRTEGDITFNGSTCTYNPQAGAVEKPCQGQEGQVNGVTVCVPYDDKTNVIESVSKDSNSVSDSDSSKNKNESSEKSTKCEGNKCTTTTTTTYNYNGTTGTRSETKTESKDDFCSKNPAAAQCKGGSFAGSCSGGFTCDGDAVQCAIAREQHKRACSLFDATSPERALYESSKAVTGNQAPTVPGVAITSSSFDTSNALGPAACLVDVPVTIANHQLTVPFSKVCPHLDMLKAVLIAVSLLLAVRIVSRG